MKQAKTFYDVIKILEKQGLYLTNKYKSKWVGIRKHTVLKFEYSNCCGSLIKPDTTYLKNFTTETFSSKINNKYYKGILISHKKTNITN